MKRKYKVYFKYYLDAEEEENCIDGDWNLAGETFAVSESKAINNVRYRTIGNVSQYLPICASCHWENGLEWKAEAVG